MAQKILITGASGMLGKDLIDIFSKDKRYEVIGLSRKRSSKKKGVQTVLLDLTDTIALKKFLKKINPEIIIHCAALVNVDACEQNHIAANGLHIQATKVLAAFRAKKNKFIYISTDSVFNGKDGNYKENDKPKPLNYYALSKLKGEQVAQRINPHSLVVRTNIYGFHIPSGNSLAEWALDNFKKNKEVKGLEDVYFNPLYTKQLARILKKIIEGKEIYGILNMASKESISKYSFLHQLAKVFRKKNLIHAISLNDLKFTVKRPRNTTLNTNKLKKIIKNIPSLEQGLKEMKKDYTKVFLNNLYEGY